MGLVNGGRPSLPSPVPEPRLPADTGRLSSHQAMSSCQGRSRGPVPGAILSEPRGLGSGVTLGEVVDSLSKSISQSPHRLGGSPYGAQPGPHDPSPHGCHDDRPENLPLNILTSVDDNPDSGLASLDKSVGDKSAQVDTFHPPSAAPPKDVGPSPCMALPSRCGLQPPLIPANQTDLQSSPKPLNTDPQFSVAPQSTTDLQPPAAPHNTVRQSSLTTPRISTQQALWDTTLNDLQQDADLSGQAVYPDTVVSGQDAQSYTYLFHESSQVEADIVGQDVCFHRQTEAVRRGEERDPDSIHPQSIHHTTVPGPTNIHYHFNIGSVKVNGEGNHVDLGGHKYVKTVQESADGQHAGAENTEIFRAENPGDRQWDVRRTTQQQAMGLSSFPLAAGFPELLEQSTLPDLHCRPSVRDRQHHGRVGHRQRTLTQQLPADFSDLSHFRAADSHHQTDLKQEQRSEPARCSEFRDFSQTSDASRTDQSDHQSQTHRKQASRSSQIAHPTARCVQVSDRDDCHHTEPRGKPEPITVTEYTRRQDTHASGLSCFNVSAPHHDTELKGTSADPRLTMEAAQNVDKSPDLSDFSVSVDRSLTEVKREGPHPAQTLGHTQGVDTSAELSRYDSSDYHHLTDPKVGWQDQLPPDQPPSCVTPGWAWHPASDLPSHNSTHLKMKYESEKM